MSLARRPMQIRTVLGISPSPCTAVPQVSQTNLPPLPVVAAAMRALLCALLSAALLLAWLMGSLSSQQPSETAWLEPSFCSTSDLNFNRYVSFVPGFDASDAADPGSLPPVDTEPALGYGCPADLVRSTPQDFVLPIDIGCVGDP